jgi:glycerophosphoryl diester phosphodiesterase
LSAFRLAWEQDADAIEGDFFLTKDLEIACIHDEKTKRTSGVEMNVATATLEELRRLDVGRWKDARFAGEKIPTLAEVLAIVPAGKKIYIEIKCGPEIVPHLIPVLRKSGLKAEQTIVISFNDRVIAATRQQIPDIKAFWLVGIRQNKQTQQYEPTADAIFEKAALIQTEGLDIQAQRELVTTEFVSRLRKQNLEFHIWTVNNPGDARHFQMLGVDSITTDRPAFLREQLKLK